MSILLFTPYLIFLQSFRIVDVQIFALLSNLFSSIYSKNRIEIIVQKKNNKEDMTERETKTIDPELEQSCQLYGKEKGSLFYKT